MAKKYDWSQYLAVMDRVSKFKVDVISIIFREFNIMLEIIASYI